MSIPNGNRNKIIKKGQFHDKVISLQKHITKGLQDEVVSLKQHIYRYIYQYENPSHETVR